MFVAIEMLDRGTGQEVLQVRAANTEEDAIAVALDWAMENSEEGVTEIAHRLKTVGSHAEGDYSVHVHSVDCS